MQCILSLAKEVPPSNAKLIRQWNELHAQLTSLCQQVILVLEVGVIAVVIHSPICISGQDTKRKNNQAQIRREGGN